MKSQNWILTACALAAISGAARAQCFGWSPRFGGTHGLDFEVHALAVLDDGNGPTLFAVGEGPANYQGRLARFDGVNWTNVSGASAFNRIHALLAVDDAFGAGPTLYVGGFEFECGAIRAWRNGALNLVEEGFTNGWYEFDPTVFALAMHDDGSGTRLYAGGEFDESTCTDVTPHPAINVAKFDGTTWTAVGGGIGHVHALASYDDGSGPALYAAGNFVSRWDGSTWTSINFGINGSVNAMCTFDDGVGPALFVGGTFTTAGGVPASRIARWDGSTWSALGAGVNQAVTSLIVFDDGSGPALYAGGAFNQAGGVSASRVAKWNGTSWSALGNGVMGTVNALSAGDDGLGGGADLYAGGFFTSASGVPSEYVAEWYGCEHDGVTYCFGDELDPVVTAQCPCGNFGEPFHGCGNFPFTKGARMTASGTTSPNTILFTCTDLPNNTLCTFLRGGNNVAAGFVFGDGVRCVQTPLLRFGQQNSGIGGNSANTAITATLDEAPGVTRYYQCQYRNPVAGWCDPGLFNVSNGYRLAW